MKTDEIEAGHDLVETMENNRRRRAEAEQGEGLGELSRMLLAVSVALARFTARSDFGSAAQAEALL